MLSLTESHKIHQEFQSKHLNVLFLKQTPGMFSSPRHVFFFGVLKETDFEREKQTIFFLLRENAQILIYVVAMRCLRKIKERTT